jgi:hypothetical protein
MVVIVPAKLGGRSARRLDDRDLERLARQPPGTGGNLLAAKAPPKSP